MTKKHPNPDFSAALQHLLDMKALGEGESTVDKLIEKMRNDAVLRTKADKMWANHQYPNKAMKYVKSSNYNYCRARYEISVNANMILTLFEHVMHQSGLCQISVGNIGECAFVAKVDKRTVQRAIKELQDNGFIAIHTPAIGRQAPIYMINPYVAKAGKPISQDDINEFTSLIKWTGNPAEHPLLKFQALQNRKGNIAIANLSYPTMDGKVLKFNSLNITANIEKEPAASDTTDSDQELDELFD